MATMIAASVLTSTATAVEIAALASTITTGFTIASTAFSVVSSIAQGNNQAALLEGQARNDAENARLNESLVGAETAEKNLADMKTLKKVLATQNATGRSAVIIEDSMAEAAKTFDIRNFQSDTQRDQLLKDADNSLAVGFAEAEAAQTGGLVKAAGSLFDFAIRSGERTAP